MSLHPSFKQASAKKIKTHPGQARASAKKKARKNVAGPPIPVAVSGIGAGPFKISGRIVSVGFYRNGIFLRTGHQVLNSADVVVAAFANGGYPVQVFTPKKKKPPKPPSARIDYHGDFRCKECCRYTEVASGGLSFVPGREKPCRHCGKIHRVWR